MAKSFVDHKARTGIPDAGSKLSKVTNSDEWGANAAVRRGYGPGTKTFPPPRDTSQPQDPIDKPAGFNDVPENSWLRGGGKGAEGYAGFVPTRTGKRR